MTFYFYPFDHSRFRLIVMYVHISTRISHPWVSTTSGPHGPVQSLTELRPDMNTEDLSWARRLHVTSELTPEVTFASVLRRKWKREGKRQAQTCEGAFERQEKERSCVFISDS